MYSDPMVHIVENGSEALKSLEILFNSVGLETASYPSGLDFLRDADLGRPGCILLEVVLPGLGGLELQAKLVAQKNTHPLIFMSSYVDVAVAVRAMKAGAFDFLQKPVSEPILIDVVWKAIDFHKQMWAKHARIRQIQSRLDLLSAREQEVLSLVVTGKPTKQIAAELGLSHKTIENHRSSIMEKMGASGAVELVHSVLLTREQCATRSSAEAVPALAH